MQINVCNKTAHHILKNKVDLMIISREASGPILQTVSAAAPFNDLWIPSLKADSL